MFLVRCQLIKQQQIHEPQVRVGLFSPDKLTVNGNSLSGELKGETESVRFIYQLKSQAEQKYWRNLREIVQAHVIVKKITDISGPRNIGEFNFKKYQNNKDIHYSLQVVTIEQPQVFKPKTISDKINVLRIHIINYLAALPHWLRVHSQSLLVGYTGYTDKDFLKILSVLGIIHLFSLSGLHVLILLTLILKLTSAIKMPVEWVNTSMLAVLPCYGLLVGSKSGIWRAIVLVMVGIIFQKLKISVSRLDIFSVTLIICLWIYPFAIVEMGGQLSFLLSFAILYLYRQASFLLTIFKMNLVSLPIICFYTYQFNWLSLLINFFFVPIFTYFILPITIISALTVKWSYWKTINYVFDELYRHLDIIANDPNFIFITGHFSEGLVVILVIIVLFYVESRNFFNKYLLQYLIVLSICILINKFPVFGSVNLVDVGQGDSIMITTPLNRKTFLIDTAGKLSFPVPGWAKRVNSDQVTNSTIPFLKYRGITHIDKLFLTHKDVDHVGNLERLLSTFRVNEVNFGVGLENNPRIKAAIKAHPTIKFKNLRQGDIVDTGFIKWQVLWPKVSSVGENGDSLTLLAQIKHKKWLFTGDLDSESEKKILFDHNFQVDYLKVGHHGSKTATSNQLLDAIQPKWGFISAGIDNRYGHPNKETLERLDNHQVKYLNTAEYGMISWYYYFFNDEEKITTFLKGDLIENNRTKK
ncbi:DNA internalization-related competence protein ComEC/Rec2 [Companilactobacillus kimchiensis]|nr:DNA internalization-related competence protein ComEC/Rec2 [Companilactobacillus kimchiensis]